MGSACARIFVVRRLGGIVTVTPVAVRHGYHHGRMTGVISSQGTVFMFLLTMHGHFYHVDGASSVLGALWLSALPKGYTCPSGEAKTCSGGSGIFYDTGGLGRGGEMSPRMPYSARGLSARLRRDRVCRSCLERLTCCQCSLGPLWQGSFITRAGCRILPPVGYPRYFDTQHLCLQECKSITSECDSSALHCEIASSGTRCSSCKPVVIVTLRGCHLLDDLVVVSVEARKKIVWCSGEVIVRGVLLAS
jgi:hypothetical protein